MDAHNQSIHKESSKSIIVKSTSTSYLSISIVSLINGMDAVTIFLDILILSLLFELSYEVILSKS